MRTTVILDLFLLLGIASLAFADAYLDAGSASTDREWRSADYANLAKLLESKTVDLPLLKTPEGAKVIQRLCSTENLSFARNRTLPFPSRMEDFMGMQAALNSIAKRFGAAAVAGSPHPEELSLLLGQNLRLAALGIELMDEFIPTLKRDETYETRKNGVAKMKRGLASLFFGGYVSVAEDKIYSAADRAFMLEILAEVAPKFASTMSPDTKTEMKLKFDKLRERFTKDKDRANLESITKAWRIFKVV